MESVDGGREGGREGEKGGVREGGILYLYLYLVLIGERTRGSRKEGNEGGSGIKHTSIYHGVVSGSGCEYE